MKINYFGEVAEQTNKTSEVISLKHNTLMDLITHLQSSYNLHIEDIHIAVNHNIINKEEELELNDSDEVAILSPFAGG